MKMKIKIYTKQIRSFSCSQYKYQTLSRRKTPGGDKIKTLHPTGRMYAEQCRNKKQARCSSSLRTLNVAKTVVK